MAWIAALALGGCTPSLQSATRDVTQAAVPAAIDSTLKTLDQQQTRDRVLDIMSSPEMQKSIALLAANFARGATEGLTSDEMAKRSTALASVIAATASQVAVDAVLSQSTSAANEKRMAELISVATAAATRSAIESMATEMPRTLGPALSEMLRDSVTPAVRGVVSGPEVRSSLGTIAFELSRQAVLGSNEGMAELEREHHKKGLLAHLTSMFAEGGLVTILAVLAGAAIIGLLVALFMTRSKLKHAVLAQRIEDDVESRDDERRPRRRTATNGGNARSVKPLHGTS